MWGDATIITPAIKKSQFFLEQNNRLDTRFRDVNKNYPIVPKPKKD